MVHTTHPEAIERHRSYITIARIELRREARDKLHRMLIEASDRGNGASKRCSEEAHTEQNQLSKRARVSESRHDTLSSNVESLDPSALLLPRDPYAAPMFHSGDLPSGDWAIDPYAARLYQYQEGYQAQAQVAGVDNFLLFHPESG